MPPMRTSIDGRLFSMVVYSFQYADELRHQAAAWSNPGRFWAEQIRTAPPDTDVAAWEERGVRLPPQLGSDQRAYAHTFIAAVQAAASDPDTASDFIGALQGVPLPSHCTQELIVETVQRVLHSSDLVPDAAVPVTDWALAAITDPALRLDTARGALQLDTPVLPSKPPGMQAQHEIISRLADRTVREPLVARISARDEEVTKLRKLPAFGHAAPAGPQLPAGSRPPGPSTAAPGRQPRSTPRTQ